MSAQQTAAKAGGRNEDGGALVRMAIGFTAWAERWFPDAVMPSSTP